ncbi:MAG: hypothetical protein NXH85_14415 [Pseudomonadaceae bacterium]|nr:hypothetical protein [Pseudomonadaceae bacterium]
MAEQRFKGLAARPWQSLAVFRRITLAILFLTSASAGALGLGEIELDSALNERFDGEIEVLDSRGLDTSEILVSLGSAEDFRRVGVERFFYLTDLRFEVERSGSGAVIKVTSSQPITEPYLNFLVEVLWPSGRMLKEYTVLLDPPTFGQAPPAAVAPPTRDVAGSSGAGRVPQSNPASSGGTQVRVPASNPSTPARTGQSADGKYGATDRNDTLWQIAERTRPSSSLTVQQYMLAIQRMNPEAFINNNINYLKAGYTLDLPSENEARSLSAAEASGEVAQQTQEWRDIRSGRVPAARDSGSATQVAQQGDDAGLRSTVDARPEQDTPVNQSADAGAQLRIVAGEAGSGGSPDGSGDAGDAAAVAEENDRLLREVEALSYQLDQQRTQVEKDLLVQQRQIEVKDQQIAQLQEQLAAMRDARSDEAQNQSTPSSVETPWWQTTPVLFGGAGALVLGLIGFMVARRRSNDDDDDFDYDSGDVTFADEPAPDRLEPEVDEASGFEAEDVDESYVDDPVQAIDDGDVLELDDELDISPDADSGSSPTSQTSDVLGEAEIYIAYGRYPQAVGLLLGVLEDDPDRHDVRAKLLELYAETGDVEAFEEQRDALVERCDDDELLDQVRELEARIAGAADDADDSSLDFSPEPSSGGGSGLSASATAVNGLAQEAAEATSASDDFASSGTLDDFDLDIEDDDLDLDTLDLDAESPKASAEVDDSAFELEFENDADDQVSAEVAATTARAGDDLGGDLGMDFDPDAPATSDANLTGTNEALDGDLTASFDDELDALAEDTTGVSDLDDLDGDDFDEDDLDRAFAEAESSGDEGGREDFDFADDDDGANTKIDLARAYIDMADEDGARDILGEVLEEGNDEQRKTAQELLDGL